MPGYDCCCNDDICCALRRFIGQTVTIFTESGGLSGSGFTGVLVSVDDCFVRLITRVGGAPSCPVGSDCGYPGSCGYGYDGYAYGYGGYGYGGYGGGKGKGGCGYYNPLGSITVIPIESIASFVHNAI
ncbi:hypothetical protein [Vallitalea okinawensis]|uniref:hypothetical protein n=1 Tax=Vallitalea okinawensis TaxID=2078660 RepID=UPI000CFDF6A7|nr:hypothetical protein [Vallitalea okinawensis]